MAYLLNVGEELKGEGCGMRRSGLLWLSILIMFVYCVTVPNVGIVPTTEASPGTPKIFVNPPSIIDPSLSPDPPYANYFPVTIEVSDIPYSPPDCYGLVSFEFKLRWTASLLGQSGYMYYEEGAFLGSAGASTSFWPRDYYDVEGYDYAYIIDIQFTPFKPVYGSGTLATVWFYPIEGWGSTVLDLYETKLLVVDINNAQHALAHDVQDGFFANVIENHDIAVTSVTASPTNVEGGQNVTINTTVKNEGDQTETNFEVKTYYDSTIIETKTVASLTPGSTTTVTTKWNTTGVAAATYTIKSYVPPVPGETVPNQADNTLIDGTVTVYYTHNVAIIGVTATPASVKIGQIVTVNVTAKNKGTVTEPSFTVTAYYDTTAIGTQTVTSLASGAETTKTFYWNTTGVAADYYQIKGVASTVPGETYTVDNTFIDGTVTVSDIKDVAITSVTRNPTQVSPGETVNVTVVTKNEGTIAATFLVTAYYNTSATTWIQIANETVYSLAPASTTTLTLYWNTTGVAAGTYTIKAVADYAGEEDPSDNTFIDGTVLITAPQPHDVAVTSVSPSPTTVYLRQTVTITVIVQNQGTNPETFSVTAYCDNTLIGTQSVTNLIAGTGTTLTFNWNTTGFTLGTYTIKANATIVPGETDTADNTKIDGTVTVKVTDANNDGKVNIIDLAYIGKAWNVTPASNPEIWNRYGQYVDFNNDYIIDGSDLGLLSDYWGYGG